VGVVSETADGKKKGKLQRLLAKRVQNKVTEGRGRGAQCTKRGGAKKSKRMRIVDQIVQKKRNHRALDEKEEEESVWGLFGLSQHLVPKRGLKLREGKGWKGGGRVSKGQVPRGWGGAGKGKREMKKGETKRPWEFSRPHGAKRCLDRNRGGKP